MNTFDLTLDLSKQVSMEPLRLRQGDKSGTTVRAIVYDHGELVSGSYTARIAMRHPGTGATYYRETGTFSNGVATFTIDEQYAATVTGRTTGYVQLLQGSTVIASTADFPVVILRDATEGAVPGEVYDSAIEDALAELDEATGRISVMVQEQVAEELAAHPEWTTTVTDNSVTDAKLVQTGGILSRVDRLMYRLDNLLTADTGEQEVAVVADAAATPVAGLSVYGRSTQDGTPTPSAPVAIVSVEGDSEGNISLKAQGPNWLDPSIAQSGTQNGITVSEPDADGWFTISGTSNATSAGGITMWGATDARTFPRGIYTMLVETEGTPLVESKVRLQVYGERESSFSTYITAAGAYQLDYTENGINRVSVLIGSTSSGTTVDGRFRITLVSGTTAPTAYVPYVGSVTPIDLDGHVLRSLPDGTRDEVTVDRWGHATLVQRVGVVTFDGETSVSQSDASNGIWLMALNDGYVYSATNTANIRCDKLRPNASANAGLEDGDIAYRRAGDGSKARVAIKVTSCTTLDLMKAWLGAYTPTVLYPLATPVTHDLGTVDPVALVGPDLTALTAPAAPFALTYERDLNVTLARLEAAIATLA